LEVADELLVNGGFVDDFLVLEFQGEIDAIVFTDVMDCLRGQLLGFGTDAHL
jgi:hypothetical protein